MIIYCVACNQDIKARLTNGSEIYPDRKDLGKLPFWKCDQCKNYVGCHHKTADKTKPLGCIATKELMNARKHIHALLDPLYKSKMISRKALYKKISDHLGYEFHTAEIKSIEEGRQIYSLIRRIELELRSRPYKCPTCNFTDLSCTVVANHQIREHPGRATYITKQVNQ